MCFALLLQAIFQGLSLSFLLRQLLQGRRSSLLTLTTVSPILIRQLLDVTCSLFSQLFSVLAGLPHPGPSPAGIEPDRNSQKCNTPIQRHYCSTSSARL